MSDLHQRRRGRLFVALAAVAWSTAGLFQRELSVDVATQLAGRALFAALGLLAYIGITERGACSTPFARSDAGGSRSPCCSALRRRRSSPP